MRCAHRENSGVESFNSYFSTVVSYTAKTKMVSFSCEVCNDTVLKKKLDQHVQRCHGAYFTCIDCSVTFQGQAYRQHTSCITEAEKYEKGLYKGKKQAQPVKKIPEQHKPSSKIQPVAKEVRSKSNDKKPTTDENTVTEKAKSPRKKSKDKNKKTIDLSSELTSDGDSNLYKVIKRIAKKNSKSNKDILKKMSVRRSDNGSIELFL